MEKINEKITKLTGYITRFDEGEKIHFHYKAETVSGKEIGIGVSVPKDYFYSNGGHDEERYNIVEQSDSFVNGFKLVKNQYNQYLYVSEETGELLPYIFDFATDFNDKGYAMIGKNSEVSWIDKNFNYVDNKGTKWEVDSKRLYSFVGWKTISAFSEGEIPLSRCSDSENSVAYLGLDGKLKEFSELSGKTMYTKTFFSSESDDFDDFGHAVANKDSDAKVLFAKGFYITQEKLIAKTIESGFLKTIDDEIENGLKEVKKIQLKK